jgi:hypothetical protein
MSQLTLDPDLAKVIPLSPYPHIAQHVRAGHIPFPATNTQWVELDKFLLDVAAASTRDRIHVAAYVAYTKCRLVHGANRE